MTFSDAALTLGVNGFRLLVLTFIAMGAPPLFPITMPLNVGTGRIDAPPPVV
jgi:hypothetical protein